MVENKSALILTDRKELNVEGVKEVVSFDETGASLVTENGELEVTGADIRILDLDTSSGKVLITGRIDSLVYVADNSEKRKGLLGKLFG